VAKFKEVSTTCV